MHFSCIHRALYNLSSMCEFYTETSHYFCTYNPLSHVVKRNMFCMKYLVHQTNLPATQITMVTLFYDYIEFLTMHLIKDDSWNKK